MRTIIDLPEEQIQALALISEREKVSRAELIRRAVAGYLSTQTADTGQAFGLWRERQLDALEYQHRLRDEWSR